MAKNIVGLNIDGISFTNRPFATCSTASDTEGKEVTYSGFELVTYATILVKFTNGNTVTSPTLNVNGTGAKTIIWDNSLSIGDKIKAGGIYEFIYISGYWNCLRGMDTNNAVTQIPTTSNITYPLLMGMNPASSSSQITAAVRYHSGLTYNPSTKILGLGVLNCTTSGSGDDSNKIDIYANSPLPTTYKIGFTRGEDNTAPATSINLAYSGPGMTATEAATSTGLSIGPKIVDDTTTDGFLISTDKPLHIEGSSLSFGSNVIPNQNETYNLGTSDNKWNEVHAESFKGTADSARLIPYGVCLTASATAAKTVTTSVPFVLETGARISVKFNYPHTGSNMTLNVNNTGEKNVYLNGSPVGAGIIFANNIYEFIYDGSKWILQPGVHNRTGSGNLTTKLYLIGASTQNSLGDRTFSNSSVYMTNGSIYTNGGFYDNSTTTGASPYKAVVPKDYTEDIGNSTADGLHSVSGTLTTSISIPSPKFGELVGEYFLIAGEDSSITVQPTMTGRIYSTTISIVLNTVNASQNFRFVRFILSVPVTVQNNSTYPTTFKYIVSIKLNGGIFRSIEQIYTMSAGAFKDIGELSIIYDLRKQTIIDDTANGTTSWI